MGLPSNCIHLGVVRKPSGALVFVYAEVLTPEGEKLTLDPKGKVSQAVKAEWARQEKSLATSPLPIDKINLITPATQIAILEEQIGPYPEKPIFESFIEEAIGSSKTTFEENLEDYKKEIKAIAVYPKDKLIDLLRKEFSHLKGFDEVSLNALQESAPQEKIASLYLKACYNKLVERLNIVMASPQAIYDFSPETFSKIVKILRATSLEAFNAEEKKIEIKQVFQKCLLQALREKAFLESPPREPKKLNSFIDKTFQEILKDTLFEVADTKAFIISIKDEIIASIKTPYRSFTRIEIALYTHEGIGSQEETFKDIASLSLLKILQTQIIDRFKYQSAFNKAEDINQNLQKAVLSKSNESIRAEFFDGKDKDQIIDEAFNELLKDPFFANPHDQAQLRSLKESICKGYIKEGEIDFKKISKTFATRIESSLESYFVKDLLLYIRAHQFSLGHDYERVVLDAFEALIKMPRYSSPETQDILKKNKLCIIQDLLCESTTLQSTTDGMGGKIYSLLEIALETPITLEDPPSKIKKFKKKTSLDILIDLKAAFKTNKAFLSILNTLYKLPPNPPGIDPTIALRRNKHEVKKRALQLFLGHGAFGSEDSPLIDRIKKQREKKIAQIEDSIREVEASTVSSDEKNALLNELKLEWARLAKFIPCPYFAAENLIHFQSAFHQFLIQEPPSSEMEECIDMAYNKDQDKLAKALVTSQGLDNVWYVKDLPTFYCTSAFFGEATVNDHDRKTIEANFSAMLTGTEFPVFEQPYIHRHISSSITEEERYNFLLKKLCIDPSEAQKIIREIYLECYSLYYPEAFPDIAEEAIFVSLELSFINDILIQKLNQNYVLTQFSKDLYRQDISFNGAPLITLEDYIIEEDQQKQSQKIIALTTKKTNDLLHHIYNVLRTVAFDKDLKKDHELRLNKSLQILTLLAQTSQALIMNNSVNNIQHLVKMVSQVALDFNLTVDEAGNPLILLRHLKYMTKDQSKRQGFQLNYLSNGYEALCIIDPLADGGKGKVYYKTRALSDIDPSSSDFIMRDLDLLTKAFSQSSPLISSHHSYYPEI